MSANDFGNMPQCFQIPATEKPRFFAVRSGTEPLAYGLDARTDALCDRSISPIISFLAVLKAAGRSCRSTQAASQINGLRGERDIEKWSMWHDMKIILRTRVNVIHHFLG
jgi:hypothetical protein